MAQPHGQWYRQRTTHEAARAPLGRNKSHAERRRKIGRPPPNWRGPSARRSPAGNDVAGARLAQALSAPDLADVIELLEPDAARPAHPRRWAMHFRPRCCPSSTRPCATSSCTALPKDVLAKAVAELETDDAAYLLEDLDEAGPAGNPGADAEPAIVPRSSATWNTPRRPPAVSCRRTSWRCRRSGPWGR